MKALDKEGSKTGPGRTPGPVYCRLAADFKSCFFLPAAD